MHQRWRRLLSDPRADVVLAIVFSVALEAEVLTSAHRHGPVALNVLVVALLTTGIAWRRRAPLAFATYEMTLGIVMSASLTEVTDLPFSLFVLLIPAYTVASNEQPRRALIGLAICIVGAVVVELLGMHGATNATGAIFTTIMASGAWLAGRATRARRELTAELTDKAAWLESDGEDRAQLALSDERTWIAREMQAVVANSVTEMVVQADAAERLLASDAAAADQAIATIERTGRDALSELRRILGVLRRADESPQLAPQPGVGQLPDLVERARGDGRSIELRVEGEPEPLPASVDLAVFRITQEALASAEDHGAAQASVRVSFAARDVLLEIRDSGNGAGERSVVAISERVAVCGGMLQAGAAADGYELNVTLPRTFDELVT